MSILGGEPLVRCQKLIAKSIQIQWVQNFGSPWGTRFQGMGPHLFPGPQPVKLKQWIGTGTKTHCLGFWLSWWSHLWSQSYSSNIDGKSPVITTCDVWKPISNGEMNNQLDVTGWPDIWTIDLNHQQWCTFELYRYRHLAATEFNAHGYLSLRQPCMELDWYTSQT